MTKHVFAAAVITAALVGCSQDELVEKAVQNSISFNLLTETPSREATPRATPVSSMNLTTAAPNFQVWAYGTDGVYVGKNATQGIKIVYAGGKWDYEDQNDVAYWPATALDFYAVNPYNAGTYNVAKASQTVTFEVKEANAHQVDLMYGIKKNQLQNTEAGKVTMRFKHALAQVIFKGVTESNTLRIEVKDIAIHNLKYKGVFTFPSAEDTPATAASWALDAETKNFVAGMAAPTVKISKPTGTGVQNNPKNLTKEDTGAFLLMPQTSTAWATAPGSPVSVATADASKHTYLKITLKYYSIGGALIYGTDAEYKDVYVPFKAEWEPGKRYIYTLKFGGGYDAAGNPVLGPISYSPPVVEAWTDSPSEISGF